MNELHELTAGFFLLAAKRGWRPNNLPLHEHQRRAFVFFTTLTPPVLLLLPVYKTGNICLLEFIFELLAGQFVENDRAVAYQKVTLSFLTTLRRAKKEPAVWAALAAALPRCLDVAQETLVSVLSRMTPDVDIQHLDYQRVREVAWSFNVLYPDFHQLLASLNINEEPHAFHANISAETRLPTADRQLSTFRLLEEILADDASSSTDLISACAKTADCASYIFPLCRGMIGGTCGPTNSKKAVVWSAFSKSGLTCHHRTCLYHASALNMPDAENIPIEFVNAVASRSKLDHIKLPSLSSRAAPRRSTRAAAAAATSGPRIGGDQLAHAEKRARLSYSDAADKIATKEDAIAAVNSWKSFERKLRSEKKADPRHGKTFQRCNCRDAACELAHLEDGERRRTRMVLCISCGVVFLSTVIEIEASEQPKPSSSVVYICGRHGCCGGCVAVATSSSSTSHQPGSSDDYIPFSGDFPRTELSLIPGSQCPIDIRQMGKVCSGGLPPPSVCPQTY